jgi:hypothetical protein
VLIPIPNSKTSEEVIAEMGNKIESFRSQLESIGVKVVTDLRLNYTPG